MLGTALHLRFIRMTCCFDLFQVFLRGKIHEEDLKHFYTLQETITYRTMKIIDSRVPSGRGYVILPWREKNVTNVA